MTDYGMNATFTTTIPSALSNDVRFCLTVPLALAHCAKNATKKFCVNLCNCAVFAANYRLSLI